jgi:hypothetical protein
MSNTRDSSSEFALAAAVVLVIVGYLIYLTLRGWATSIGIDVPALLSLIFGIVVDAGVATACMLGGWNRARILPWLLPFSFLCLCPSLTCWATSNPGGLQLAYMPDGEDVAPVAWYGQHVWQFLAFSGACVGSFFLMKRLDDGYGYRW